MGRWEPDAQRRLREAALELFEEQGYERTTVAQIAERADLTARTFFRHYADKREVLFAGSALLQQRLVDVLDDMDPANPFEAAATAVERAFDGLGVTRAAARRRAAVIDSTTELRERELVKMASLADSLADGLRQRGVPDPDAMLAADSAVTAMRIAFNRWTGAKRGSLTDTYRSTVLALQNVTAAGR